MRPLDPSDEVLLRRHLDGDLDVGEETSFLARLQASPDLRRALAERAIDEALLSEVVREGRRKAPVRSRFGWSALAAAALMLAALGFFLSPPTPKPAPSAEKPSFEAHPEIDASIQRACRYLETRRADLLTVLEDGKRHDAAPRRTYGELAALALLRAGTPRSHPLLDELIGRSLGRPLESTYVASLRAMLLSELGAVERGNRLRVCAQFLVDSQCPNGQWDYGRALPLNDAPLTGVIRRRHDGPANGDNSVTGWAVQGLLACKRAGVDIEADVLVRARRWWVSSQNPDGGWGYAEYGAHDQTGADKTSLTSNSSYGSATATGLASLAALGQLLGPDADAGAAIDRGSAWLAENFATAANPRKAAGFAHVHWLVAAERAGLLLGREAFGTHPWYSLGSAFLLSRQGADGEWALEGDFMKGERNTVVDTCLAILFLTRKG